MWVCRPCICVCVFRMYVCGMCARVGVCMHVGVCDHREEQMKLAEAVRKQTCFYSSAVHSTTVAQW